MQGTHPYGVTHMCKKSLKPKLLRGRNDSISKLSPLLLAKDSNTATSLGMDSRSTTTTTKEI